MCDETMNKYPESVTLEKEAEDYASRHSLPDYKSAITQAYIDGYYSRDEEVEPLKKDPADYQFNYSTIKELKDTHRWYYPTKGELPYEGKYLVYMSDGTIDILEIRINGNGEYYFNGIGWDFKYLVAWQYLPEPPEEKKYDNNRTSRTSV